jgi:DNA-binding MarR family transcriptional regulator
VGEHRWLDEREQRAWRSLMTMQADLSQHLDRQLRTRDGLSTPDFEVLAHLSETPDGRLRAFALCRLLRWEKSRLSQHLTRMEKRGLISREPCTTDQRGAFVVITPEGRTLIEAAAGPHVDDVRAVLIDHLTPDQLDLLAELGDQVRARLTDIGEK